MIIFSRVKQALSEFVKVIRYGTDDVQTAEQYLPFGIDSKPIKDALAAFIRSSNSEEAAILGYLIESEETEEGETRVYSTSPNGDPVFYIKLLNGETEDHWCEVGGNADFMVRFTSLDDALQQFVTDLNTKLVTALGAVGGSWPGTSLDISGAKIEEVKTL